MCLDNTIAFRNGLQNPTDAMANVILHEVFNIQVSYSYSYKWKYKVDKVEAFD
jgi:hypothetical protein